MARYYGVIGYAVTCEQVDESGNPTGVWVDEITERRYYGEVTKNLTRWQNANGINDNLGISNKISIIADPYAYQNFSHIKYAEWMGVKWKVTDIEVARPRLIMSIGGEYNE